MTALEAALTALGCRDVAVARFAVLEIGVDGVDIRSHETPCDPVPVLRALEDRRVPERELIREAFLRFPS